VNPEPETANPYVGLRPFEPEDNLYFFGRREQTAALLEQLHQTHFLAVVGGSGCGKSSLIRAGLIPSLLGGFLVEDRDAWQIAIMKPGDAPLYNLAVALCQTLDKAPGNTQVAGLHEALVSDHMQAVISYLMPQLGTNTSLLLLIDQFEEIFSSISVEEEDPLAQLNRQQRRQRAQRRAEADDFVDLILELKADTQLPIYTVLTMRTDFLGDCDVFYGLPEAMNESRYLVPRLSRQQLQQAIEGPARLARTSIAPRLLDRLLNQLGDRADRLPILQHALLRTWDIWRRDGKAYEPMDLAHYEAAGTLQKALSQHADEALRQSDFDTTAKIFKSLTATDANHRRVRRPARLSELVAVAEQPSDVIRAILKRFCEDGRNFLVLSASDDVDDPRIDISHESLIRQWDTLRAWVDEERESRDQLLDLVHRGHGYRLGARALIQEPELQIALDWRAATRPTVDWAKRYCTREDDFDVAIQYLERSRQAAQQRRRLHRLGFIAPTLLVLVFATHNVYYHLYSRFLYLSAKEGLSENIELHRGNPDIWDPFDLRRYIAETDYQRSQIELSRRFEAKNMSDPSQIETDLVDVLKPTEKIKSLWKNGKITEAYEAILNYIKDGPENKYEMRDVMSGFRSSAIVEELKKNLLNEEMKDIHKRIMDMMPMLPMPAIIDILQSNKIEENNEYPPSMHIAMIEALASISYADFAAGRVDKIQSTLASLAKDSSKEGDELDVRVRAEQALMRLGDTGAVERLISLAGDKEHRSVRQEALEALAGSKDKRVFVFLNNKLQLDLEESRNYSERRRTVEAFAQIGAPQVVSKLRNELVRDSSIRIRQSVVRALGQTGEPEAVQTLLGRLPIGTAGESEEDARAASALSRLYPSIGTMEDELEVLQSIVEALGQLGHDDGTVQFLLENVLRLDDNSPDADAAPGMARVTMEALVRIGTGKTYEALAAKLEKRDVSRDESEISDENISHRKQGVIIDLMGRLGDDHAISPLKELLAKAKSAPNGIYQNVAEALGRLGEASAVDDLRNLIDKKKDHGQLNIVSTLGRLGDRQAIDILRPKVEKQGVDKQNIIYLGAMAALGQLSDARVLDDLTNWLQQENSRMRQINLEILVGPSRAGRIERWIASESGEDGDVRQVAVEVLGEFGSVRPMDLLLARLRDGSVFVRRGATRALGRLGKRDIGVVEQLMAHLDDGDSGVRQNAAEALGQLGNPRAVTSLIALLQDSDGNVRREAAHALGRLGDARALEPLLRLLRGAQDVYRDGVEDVRRSALLASAKIGLKSHHPEPIVCTARSVFNNASCDLTASQNMGPEHERMRLAAAVVLLALQPSTPPDAIVEAWLDKAVDPSQSISRRRELAEMLGDFPTEKGRKLLLDLLHDSNLGIQESALKALGKVNAREVMSSSQLTLFFEPLRRDNFRLQKAAAEALAEITSVNSIDTLATDTMATVAGDPRIGIPARVASLKALYNIANHSKDNKVRETIIKRMLAAIQSEIDQTILGIHVYNLLGDLQDRQALKALQEHLKAQESFLRGWGQKPDRLQEAKLARQLAFELAYNIARIDPENSGLGLLDHDLADIRQGAWQGLGSVGNVDLIAQLHRQLQDRDRPWFKRLSAWFKRPWGKDQPLFRYAAYQAIDRILLKLETEDIKPKPGELERLKELAAGAEEWICKRVEWTLEHTVILGGRSRDKLKCRPDKSSHSFTANLSRN
jgi:HEAT repeat protein